MSGGAGWGGPVDVGGLALAHPVLNASGTLDAHAALAALGDAALGCAAHVTKTITPLPRPGNPPPRIAEAASGLVNSIGLPGPGLAAFREGLPALAAIVGVPIVASVGGFSVADYVEGVAALDGEAGVAALELNVSCPNVETGCASIGADAAETAAVTAACRARTGKPLWVKLSPGVTDVAAIARAAVGAGADALVLTNTVPAQVHDRWRGGNLMGGGGGGLSGAAIRPVALRAVALAAEALPGVPIVGLGGVEGGQDALDLLRAGARAVAVGTATFRDPDAPRRVLRELRALGGAAAAG